VGDRGSSWDFENAAAQPWPKLEESEKKLAQYAGVNHAVATNSGTGALHLIICALGIGEGDEVITTSFSFISSSNCILFEGANPVFVRI